MAKDPAFPFYASDWLGSTKRALMTMAQRGAYVDLLCHQWGDETCSLPDDDVALSLLSGLNDEWLKGGSCLLRECFPKHPTIAGRVANPRLLEIKAQRDEWIAKSAEGGRKSGRARRAKSRQQRTSDDENSAKGGSTTLGTKLGTKHEPNTNIPSPFPSPPNSSCRNLRFDESDRATAEWMFSKILAIHPANQKPDLDKWANELRLMRERDKRTDAEIRELFEWANGDDFWRANILSPAKLRKQWDQLTIKRSRSDGKPETSGRHRSRHYTPTKSIQM